MQTTRSSACIRKGPTVPLLMPWSWGCCPPGGNWGGDSVTITSWEILSLCDDDSLFLLIVCPLPAEVVGGGWHMFMLPLTLLTLPLSQDASWKKLSENRNYGCLSLWKSQWEYVKIEIIHWAPFSQLLSIVVTKKWIFQSNNPRIKMWWKNIWNY